MGKKNNKSVKIQDHELPVGPAADQSENSTGINYLIGNKSIVAIFYFLFHPWFLYLLSGMILFEMTFLISKKELQF